VTICRDDFGRLQAESGKVTTKKAGEGAGRVDRQERASRTDKAERREPAERADHSQGGRAARDHAERESEPDSSLGRSGHPLDKIDHLLLAKLRENSRASVSELGRDLGLSRTTVQSRIKRLERAKVITGYSVRVAETHEKNQIHAYVMITVGPKRAAAVSAEIKRMPAVRLLQSVSGPFDMIALAVAPSVRDMDDLIDAIGNLEGVERTTSSVVLSTKLDR
jgi:DNA-binding Lrp family transcriptional regulator